MKPRLVPLIIVALALFGLLAGYATNRSPSPAYATNTAAATGTAEPSHVHAFSGNRVDQPINVAN
jgi:hypothetical protein